MRNLHQGVIHWVHQGVERLSVGTHNDEIRHVLGRKSQRTAHEVVPLPRPVRHAQSHHRSATLVPVGGALVRCEIPTVAVVARSTFGCAGPLPRLLEFGRRAETLIRPSGSQQFGGNVGIHRHPLGLSVRAIRTTDLRTLIPIQPQPAHRRQQSLVALLRVPGAIGVFDPEHERAAGVSGIGPVEQRRPEHSHMRIARR